MFIVGIFQLISLILTILTAYVLISVINYISWKKRHDREIVEKLDHVIRLISKEEDY